MLSLVSVPAVASVPSVAGFFAVAGVQPDARFISLFYQIFDVDDRMTE